MKQKSWVLLFVFTLFCLVSPGCSYFAARDQIRDADRLVSDLSAGGGEKLVPYEYCSAEAFLDISRMGFDDYDYKAAKEFADRSKAAAEEGLSKVKSKK